ncbi:hypothetical protein [Rhodospira trueperi]|nr:hypothetical protein [Rhodospira trueperi]
MFTPSIRAACLGLVLLLGPLAGPAVAHNMKVFATVEAGEVSGYGFFVGGGRARNAAVTATTGDGRIVFEGRTDAEGRFSFTPEGPAPQAVTVTLKVGDGHMASITLDGARFGAVAAPEAAAVTTPAPQDLPDPPEERLVALVEARVEAAVARQIRPLLEAQAEAEARIRVKDIAGGLGMILGLVGIALWALSRRREST